MRNVRRAKVSGRMSFQSEEVRGNFLRPLGCAVFGGFAVAITLATIWAAASPTAAAAPPTEVPVINGNLGPCSADFTILDSSDKPVYNAKIQVTILYGFMNKKKTDLEIGTNSDGRARFEGLPDKLKKPPLEFKVTSGDLDKMVRHDPASDCHPNFKVAFGKP